MRQHHKACFVCCLTLASALACTNSGDSEPELSRAEQSREIPKVAPIPEGNPKLGATADATPVMEGPFKDAQRFGYLHAGDKVARSTKAYGKEECDAGWFAIRPRGFVCAEGTATIKMDHPTLVAMSMGADLDQPLPYTYARTTKATPLFEQDASRPQAVRQIGKLKDRAGLAVVGSWEATDEENTKHRLALLTNGQFVRAVDLEAAKPSAFSGVELSEQEQLPVAFVVKRGVNDWRMVKMRPKKNDDLDYHSRVPLTGRFRTIDKLRYWATEGEEKWVRHRDVTVIRRRHNYPDFAIGQQKWLDVSIITGTAIAYEGRRPVFATLVSVGRDRLGDPETSRSTARGTFEVVRKHVTLRGYDPRGSQEGLEIFDLPWAFELSSGQVMHGAYWHNRFGIEHSEGGIHFSPSDARWIFNWATPELPSDWHGVAAGSEKTLVNVRK